MILFKCLILNFKKICMSQRNIERNELTITPLEIAKSQTVENLRIYGLEYGNWFWKLNFLSRIKHSFRNDYPYMDSFDDYSPNFYIALKDFQKKNWLKETWVLDIETLAKIDKNYPFAFNNAEKAKILNYFQNKTDYIKVETKVVYKETKEKILNSELDLVSDNIAKPKNEVLEKVRKSLNLTGNLEEMKKQIINFQKMHCLNETDGIIGKETYYEVVAKDYFTNEKQSEILEKWPSKADQAIILEIFQNWRIGSVELNKISIILKNFKEKNSTSANFESEFGDFYKNFDNIITEYRNSPVWKADQITADKNRESLYWAMKKIYNWEMGITEWIKEIATNPVLLLTAWVTFLFGMWWTETKMSDSWWKRILLLIAAPVVVPAAWNTLWWSEILNDVWNSAKDVKNWLKSSESQVQKNEIEKETHNFIVKEWGEAANWVKNKTNEIYNWVSNDGSKKTPIIKKDGINASKEEIEKQIYQSTNWVLNSIFSKNLSYSKSGNESEKSKFIEKDDFELFSKNIASDSVLSTKLIADIDSIKSDSWKLKSMLSDETKKKLFPENLSWDKLKKREQDLVTFIWLLLNEKESKDIYISDIFIKEKGFWEKTKEFLMENEITTYIKDEPKLNTEIFTIVWSLSLNIKSEVSLILSTINVWDAENEEKINKLTKYINENSSKIWNDKEKLQLLRNIYLMELEYKKFVTSVDKIDINGGKDSMTKLNEEKAKIDKKYNEIKLSKPKNNSNKIFREKINEKILTKEKEIYNATVDKDSLWDVKNKIERADRDKTLDELFNQIGSEKPKHDLTSYREYFSNNERVLAYNKIFNDEYLESYIWKEAFYNLENNWYANIELGADWLPDVKLENFWIKTDSKEEKERLMINHIRWYRIYKARKDYKEIVGNIKKLAAEEVKNIENLKKEIENTKTNPDLYKLKQEEFAKKLSETVNRVYPNEKPESFTDISAYIDYMNKNNRTSVYSEIISKLKAVNNSDHFGLDTEKWTSSIDFDKEVLSALSSVTNVLTNETKAVEKTVKLDKKENLVSTSIEVSKAYNEYYNKVNISLNDFKWKPGIENILKNLKNPEELSKMTFGDLENYLTKLNSWIKAYNESITENNKTRTDETKKEKLINTKDFMNEFNNLNEEFKKYYTSK